MQTILLVYTVIFGAALVAVMFLLARGDEAASRRFARVRVRIDESRRDRAPEPPEEEFESQPFLGWLVGGILALLIFLLMSSI